MKPTLSLLAAFVLCALTLADDKPAKPKAVRPVVVLTGSKSRVTKEAFKLVTTKDEWDKVWTEHRLKFEDNNVGDKDQKLSIDFTQHMVLVIFDGEHGRGEGMHIEEVLDGTSLVVRYIPNTVQTGEAHGLGRGCSDPKKPDVERHSPTSYCFVVVPRVEKPVVFEEDRRQLLSDPPKWVERAKLTAPKFEKK